MCPPASSPPAAALGELLTDESICKCLMQLKSGHSLPDNILSDVDPYQYLPSNLPGTWYFCSGKKRDAEMELWKSTGEACEVYSTPAVSGYRKTLEFYKDGQKTNWVMQEYTVTEKYMNNQPDSRALYKVFLVDESSSVPLSKSQLLEKNMDDVAGTSADPILGDDDGDYLELDDLDIPLSRTPNGTDVGDYVSRARGDYLEMDDLVTPLSRTTSGTDSSCMSMTSEEYFDSEALMRDLGDGSGTHQVHLNLSVPAKLKEVVLKDANLGQTSKPGPTPQTEPGTSKCPSTSSSEETSSKEEKKDRVNRTKKRKVMKYLCFLAF